MAIDINADFTPTIPDSGVVPVKSPYNPTGSFKFWAQKVLPLVYDDSLSYYEVLCKVVNYLNNVIQNVDNLNDSVNSTNQSFETLKGYVNTTKDTLINTYNELQDYVNTYFDNLDVQQEINAKLDAMADSGKLTKLLAPFIPDLVTQWLNNHVTPTSPIIDNTLSISGAGADAKVTGDKLTALNNDFNDLSDAFIKRSYDVSRTILDNKIWDYYNNFAERALTGYFACSFNCEEDTVYKIQARNVGTDTTFAIGFIDEQGNVLSSISNLPSNPDHYATVRTPQNCVLVKFTTNNKTTPSIKIEAQKYEIPVDNTLSISGAAADAKVTGDKLTALNNDFNDLSDGFIKRSYDVSRTILHGKCWDYYNNFAEKDLTGYYACSFNCEEDTVYKIQARNVGTNTTFAIGFIDEQGNVLSSISNLPSNPDHYATVRTPQNCVLVKFTTNNQTTPIIKIEASKYEIPLDEQIVYVAPNGSDTVGDGSKEKPFQTIQKAIESGLSDTIVIAAGRYAKKFTANQRKKLHLIGDIDGGTVVDYSVTVTPSAGTSGVQEASFSSTPTDAIYRVFVTKDLPLSQQGNATAYTVNLWTYDGTTLMIPKATLTEVQATTGTWTYDGNKIYINGNSAAYKLIPTYEDIAVHFSEINDLILENITVKFAGYTNCKIEDCDNVTVTSCEFSNAGRQHGIAIEDSNATISKCKAFRNCYDGFNIHNKGNTTFIDCESGYNRDDGMSHHDGSTGTVIGGKYHHNKKGGISPTYDSKVNIYNAVCSSNGYGIYYSNVSSPTECTINGCALLGNNGYGLRVVGYNINSFGTIYSGNAANNKADGGGTIYEIR